MLSRTLAVLAGLAIAVVVVVPDVDAFSRKDFDLLGDLQEVAERAESLERDLKKDDGDSEDEGHSCSVDADQGASQACEEGRRLLVVRTVAYLPACARLARSNRMVLAVARPGDSRFGPGVTEVRFARAWSNSGASVPRFVRGFHYDSSRQLWSRPLPRGRYHYAPARPPVVPHRAWSPTVPFGGGCPT